MVYTLHACLPFVYQISRRYREYIYITLMEPEKPYIVLVTGSKICACYWLFFQKIKRCPVETLYTTKTLTSKCKYQVLR